MCYVSNVTLTFSNRGANLVGISLISRWADAGAPVVVDLAYGIDATLVVVDTGIFAFLADTCESARTVTVYCAFWLADDEWVALQSRGTSAETPVPRGPGNGILSTWIGVCLLYTSPSPRDS